MTWRAKIKAALATAAVLIVGGLGVQQALQQAGSQHELTRADFDRFCSASGDSTGWVTWYAATSGPTPPAAFGERVIGECGAGECRLELGGDGCAVITYELTAQRNGWRLFKASSHPYFAGAVKLWADATDGAEWLGAQGEAIATCVAKGFPAARCKEYLGDATRCWMREQSEWGGPSPWFCRHGLLYGPGEGGDNPCDPQEAAQAWLPMPCEVSTGAGSERTHATRTLSQEELDEL